MISKILYVIIPELAEVSSLIKIAVIEKIPVITPF